MNELGDTAPRSSSQASEDGKGENGYDYRVEIDDFAPPVGRTCCSALCANAVTRQNRELDWEAIYHLVMQLNLSARQKSMVLVRFRRVFLYVANNYSDVECYYLSLIHI